MKKITFCLIFICLVNSCKTNKQEELETSEISKIADDYYYSKNYDLATKNYLKIIELADFKSQKTNAAYNAACCLALQEKTDSAFILLNKSVKYGYKNKTHLSKDSDLEILHSNQKWKKLLSEVSEQKSLNSNPTMAKIVTSDVHHFWEAYDIASKDSKNNHNIYKKYYFDNASDGMEDYMGLKVSSIDYFINHIESHPKLYKTIKKNTLKVDKYKKDIQLSFKNLKEIYSEAKFPDVYFVMGAFTSGGTVSSSGLLIGVNQISDSDDVDTQELDFGGKLLMNKSKYLPNMVAHELIHFQQGGIKRDTITLGYAIDEGMADFIGELISGDTPNRKIFDWAKGKENKIWNDFKKDMYYNRYNNWIANYNTASENSYPDLGYWIGYEICKSYYENKIDKEQAIDDMFNIQNYREFLIESKWESKLENMK